MNLSYWEIKSWLTNVDFTIVGSGIVGLNCAIQLKNRFPEAKILILEKGVLPQGASTKNAGFACFGSLSELIEDLKTHSETEVFNLVKQRVKGLRLLRQTLGDDNIDYQEFGGYELFTKADEALYEECLQQRDAINQLLKPIFNADVFSLKEGGFGFQNIKPKQGFNKFEGQIDTGKMMDSIINMALQKGIKILNATTVDSFSEDTDSVKVKTNRFEFSTSKLLIATNGFTSKLLDKNLNLDYRVKPARAQVLITEPIKDLKIKGTFHLEKGYYYFRNIDNRILFGGGRNLDFKTEETTKLVQTELVKNKLEELLKTIILPKQDIKVDHYWSGIMGVGSQKKPIVKQLSNNVFCGVRLGGMGVAIGSLVGKELADLI